jgi:hypothetical protein
MIDSFHWGTRILLNPVNSVEETYRSTAKSLRWRDGGSGINTGLSVTQRYFDQASAANRIQLMTSRCP